MALIAVLVPDSTAILLGGDWSAIHGESLYRLNQPPPEGVTELVNDPREK